MKKIDVCDEIERRYDVLFYDCCSGGRLSMVRYNVEHTDTVLDFNKAVMG